MGFPAKFSLWRDNVWERPTLLEQLLWSPLQYFVVQPVYHIILSLRGRPFQPPRGKRPVRVCCISDTHSQTVPLEPGDLLIHAGDLTDAGTPEAIQEGIDWLDSSPFRHKVFVCGNHDGWLDPNSSSRSESSPQVKVDFKSVHYLQDSSVTLDFEDGRKLNVYGAGDIPRCGGPSFAFQYDRASHPWHNRVPDETDVLVTHTPPRHHRDLGLGCDGLLQEVWRVKPKLHVFGHVHWGRGQEPVYFDAFQEAYEKFLSRPKNGLLSDYVPNREWLDAGRFIYKGVVSILWKWIMLGPGANNAGLMVNAAQMYGNTQMMSNQVHTVEL